MLGFVITIHDWRIDFYTLIRNWKLIYFDILITCWIQNNFYLAITHLENLELKTSLINDGIKQDVSAVGRLIHGNLYWENDLRFVRFWASISTDATVINIYKCLFFCGLRDLKVIKSMILLHEVFNNMERIICIMILKWGKIKLSQHYITDLIL